MIQTSTTAMILNLSFYQSSDECTERSDRAQNIKLNRNMKLYETFMRISSGQNRRVP